MQISEKKALLKFWLRVIVALLIVVLFFQLSGLLTKRFLKDGFFYSYADKLETLSNMQGEKVVFVGGSSVLFGVSAEQYQQLSGKPTINMGLNAGPYDVYLRSIEPYINQGDTIVLALEFEAYSMQWYTFDDIFLDVAYIAKDYEEHIPITHRLEYLFKQNLHQGNKVFDVLYSLVQSKLGETDSIYIRKNINIYGDFNKELMVGTNDITPYRFGGEINEESLNEILKYIEIYENKGARVYLIYPPVYAQSDSNVEGVGARVKEKFADRVIGDVHDWTCSTDKLFFDTVYHLNSEGVQLHTEYFYELICQKESASAGTIAAGNG